MDADIEPASFDLVVVGTGLPESILAGAAAQAGKSVLHLDPGDSYGSHWATLQLENVLEWAKRRGTLTQDEGVVGQDASSHPSSPPPAEAAALETVPLLPTSPLYSDFAVRSEDGASTDEAWALPASVGHSRAYGIDLAGPRLALAAGPLIDLLIRCGAHHYLEFKAVEGSYIWHGGKLEPVPASRADVFKSRSLSLVEKRHLTRFFQLVTEGSGGSNEADIPEEDLSMPFVDFLTKHKLPPFIAQSILYCIALLEHDQENADMQRATAREGVQGLKTYLQSVGRFGPKVGAFLYPLYGCGELSQAFCRIAAVKGALYVLRRGVCSLLLDKASSRFKGVVTTTGQSILASKVITGPGLFSRPKSGTASVENRESSSAKLSEPAEKKGAPSQEQSIARCICITDAPLTPGQTNILAVFGPRSLNSSEPKNPVRVFQAGETASVSPTGRYVVQMSMVGSRDCSAEDDLKPVIEALFETRQENAESSEVREGLGKEAPSLVEPSSALLQELVASNENRTGSQAAEASSSEAAFRSEATNGGEVGTKSETETAGTASTSSAVEVQKPGLLWALYFRQRVEGPQELFDGDVTVTRTPDGGLTYSGVTTELEAAFQRLYPNLPFYPPQEEAAEEGQEGEADFEERSA